MPTEASKRAHPQLVDTQIEFLITCIDPYRNYGERTYDEVIEQVRRGVLTMYPPPATNKTLQPVIRDATTNMVVKGSGAPSSGSAGHSFTRKNEINKERFAERFTEDFDEAYAALFTMVVVKLDPRAAKIYFEMGLGAPQKQMDGGMSTDAFQAALSAIREARDNAQGTVKFINAETGEPADEAGNPLLIQGPSA